MEKPIDGNETKPEVQPQETALTEKELDSVAGASNNRPGTNNSYHPPSNNNYYKP